MQVIENNRRNEETTTALVGMVLLVLPGFLFLIVACSVKLGQFNPFLMLFLFLVCGIIALIGFITYLIAGKGLKSKLITVSGSAIFYVLIFPMIWGINGIRERIYIKTHQIDLELIANNLLNDKITKQEANEKLKDKNLVLTVICVPKEKKHVLFLLDGILDNCSGFSYSLTDQKPSENCSGDLIYWKKMKRNWYKWGTT